MTAALTKAIAAARLPVLLLLLVGCRDLTGPPQFSVAATCVRGQDDLTYEVLEWRERVCPRAYRVPCFETLDDNGNPVSDTLWVIRADTYENGLECFCTVPLEYRTP